jgi:hypothetical protein
MDDKAPNGANGDTHEYGKDQDRRADRRKYLQHL